MSAPSKPSSSSHKPGNWRRDRGRDRNQDRDQDRGTEHGRYRDRRDGPHTLDREKRNDRSHARSRSPVASSSKRARAEKSGRKGKEPIRLDDSEPGEVEVATKTYDIGDDFIPLGASDDGSAAEDERISDRKKTEPEREWDRGKSSRYDRDERRRGTKRRHDDLSDDDDDRGYRRAPMQVPRKSPWVADIDWKGCNNVAEILHREVEAFVNYMSPTPVEDEVRSYTVDLVSRAIKSAFPDARISPFGSYETKLYLPSGDIDLVVDSRSMARSNKVHVLYALANTLKRAGITSKVTVISKAKVPIVKFVTNFGRLNVDISVNQGNGVTAGKVINSFLQNMRGCGFALRSLVLVVKAFLNQRGMNEVFTGGLGSYSIVCLAISFLQMHPKIRRAEISAEKNLGVLILEFFELYGCYFNYEEVGISIRDGGSYFSKRQRGWYDSTKSGSLSIEDPIDPTNDISKGSYAIAKVRQTFAGAHGIMQATAFQRAGILNSRREGRNYPLRPCDDPGDMSILSTILGVTQETINNRRLLQEVYDERILHRLLGVCEAPIPAHSYGPVISDRGLEEGDMELGSEEEGGATSRRLGGHSDSDEEGKYHIRKKRRLNPTNHFDNLTIYTTDEEDEHSADDVGHHSDIGDIDGEAQKFRIEKREYWLAKSSRGRDHDAGESS
ncbi:hypothetical protein ID866_3922 [Astraeus odoratus]|nr:hypothetical protein ID866_3922 [Astraeus odoratus]